MKKLLLVLFLMTISLGQSQNLITNGNFENGSTGWNGNGVNVIGTTNHYNTVNVAAAGNPYDVNLSYNLSIPASGVKYKLTFDASSDRSRSMFAGIGLQGAPYTNTGQGVNLTTTSQTFELILTSNFADTASRIIFDMGAAVGQVNIDNVILELYVAPDPAPVAGPTTPTRNAGDVRSVYGATYTNPDTYILSNFGGSTITEPHALADASNVIKFSNHSYAGLAANGSPDPVGGDWNASAYTHLHMDVWSPDFVSFKIKLESTNGGNREIEVPFTKVQGSWNSYDLDLSTYTGVDLSHLKWIVPVTFGPNNTLVYMTNVYFWKPAANAPVYGAFVLPEKISTDGTFTITPPTSTNTSAFTYTSSNTGVANIVNGNQIDITGIGTATITASQVSDGTRGAGSTTTTFISTLLRNNPLVGPATPTRSAGVVKSVYGATYTNAFGAPAFNSFGGSNIVGNVVLDDASTVVKYTGHDYSGFNAGGTDQGGNFNVTTAPAATYLHMDVWSPNFTSFEVKLESTNGAGLLVNAPGAKTQRAWNSYDIPLSSYAGVNLANLKWIVLDSSPGAILYLTNVYFYQANLPTISGFSVPTKTNTAADFTITPPTTSNSAGAYSYTSSNTSVATIVNGNQIQILTAGTTTITAIQAANGAFDAGSISASFVVTAAALSTPAPTPPARNAWDVISLYSGSYATKSSPIWNASSIVTDEDLSGNAAKKLVGQGAGGLVEVIDFTATDIVQMETLHMDIYSPNESAFNIWLLSATNGDRNAVISTPINGWRSIDIPLSTYVNKGLTMTNIKSLKFEGLNGQDKTVYVDNVYFYRAATIQPPTFGAFTVASKYTTSPDFALVKPTSNSAGAFTYTSSNSAVATILGSTVTIKGAGTTIITATQAAAGIYRSAFVTAPLVVTYAPPAVAATNPSLPFFQVISVFSNSYANVAAGFTPDWGQGADNFSRNVAIVGNTTKKYPTLTYHGVDITSPLDVSKMKTIHLDIYSSNCTSLSFKLINTFPNGVPPREVNKNITLTQNAWNSINIPLADFLAVNAQLDLTSINQMSFSNDTGTRGSADIYVDNIYFWNDAVSTLKAGQCGATVGLNSVIYANPVAGATAYRFQVTNGANVRELVSSRSYFYWMTELQGSVAYNTTYLLQVQAYIGGNWGPYSNSCSISTPSAAPLTKIVPSQCQSILPSFVSTIYAVEVPLATRYRFELVNGSSTYALESPRRYFQPKELPGLAAGTYDIKVASLNNGLWGAYGGTCTITIPAPLARMSNNDLNTNVFEVKAYPNPFATNFSFDIQSSSDEVVEMKVYDMIGRQLEVKKASVSELTTQEIGNSYPAGIYNIIVSQGDNVKSIRMIKR